LCPAIWLLYVVLYARCSTVSSGTTHRVLFKWCIRYSNIFLPHVPVVNVVHVFNSDIAIVNGNHGYIFFVAGLASLPPHFSCDYVRSTGRRKLKPRIQQGYYVVFDEKLYVKFVQQLSN
jgi:hypothetical protein